jgi:hypothetical protein
MIIRGVTLYSRMAVLFVFLCALTACGGGGGGGDGGGFFPGGSDNLSMTLYDPSGEQTNTVTESAPGTLRVKVGSAGNIVVNADSDIGTVIPDSGTALTDNNGIATFQIIAGGDKGAGTISVSAATESGTRTGTLSFQVGDSGLRLGYFDEDGTFLENQIFIEPKSTLAAGGNAQFTVVVLDSDGKRITTSEEVRFSSGCIASGQSLINPEIPQATNGQASTLYTAAGCAGIDEISASVTGAAAQAFGSLKVSAPEANAINFESAEPTLIVLRGTGGGDRDETSNLLFTVVDGSGAPLPGTSVDFSLSTGVGGLSLSTPTALSNGDGEVRVTVQAGDVATVVRVIASVDDGSGEVVSTVSDLLTVTTGLPDQNSISVGIAECGDGGGFIVANGASTNGLCRQVVVRLADKFNNPVVDGTAAVFTTEYGVIQSTCTTVNGECFVEWTSQEPRFPTLTGTEFVRTIFDADYSCPDHNGNSGPCPTSLGYTQGLRSTILVHAIGEESFVDRNGNGVIDQEEASLFANLPEAFVDHNDDGVFTPGLSECQANPMGSRRCIAGNEEIFVDFNANDTYDNNDAPAIYNGLLCPPEGEGVWCSRELVHVRGSTRITMSANDTFQILLSETNGSVINSALSQFQAIGYVADLYNNPPPAGSTIALSTEGNCAVVAPSSFEVPNLSATEAFGFSVSVKLNEDILTDASNDLDPGILTVTLSPTAGIDKTMSYSCPGALDCRNIPTENPNLDQDGDGFVDKSTFCPLDSDLPICTDGQTPAADNCIQLPFCEDGEDPEVDDCVVDDA